MKVVLQDGMKDCGVCCLLSIIRFFGGDVPKEYLRELTNTTKEGVSFYNLLVAAKKIGFDVVGLSGNLENIDVNNLPCIVHFNIRKNYQHFVVLYKINHSKNNVVIMDPAKGSKTLSFSEFKLLSSNHYLFLTPNKKLPIFRKRNIVYKMIIQLIKQHKKKIFIIVFLTIQSFLFQIVSSFHLKYLIEFSIQNGIYHNILLISLLLGILYFFKNITSYLKNMFFYKWNSLLNIEISSYTYKQILLLPYLYFKNRTTGEVLSRYKDLNVVIDYLGNFFCSFITDFFTVITFFIIMFHYNTILTLTMTFILFLFSISLYPFLRIKKILFKKVKNDEDIIHSYIVQGISNVDTIKSNHLEKRFIDKYYLNYQSFQNSIYRFTAFSEIEFLIRNHVIDLIYLIVYGVGSYFVIIEKLSFGTFILFQTFIHYYINSFLNILRMISNYPTYKVSLGRVEELFLLHSESFFNSFYYLSYTLGGTIQIQNLDYMVGTHSLFCDLNLTIHPGDKVLLSGDSGSGKSTLIKMIMRYIEVDYGKILLSGIDINHYHLENIRSNITYVTANEFLFSDTLRNNILLYQNISEEEFEKVCTICQLDSLIENEKGYDMMIEENGFNLSNGERQRVVLARCLLRKSSIYIFDEALSQIDVEKERIILEKIFSYYSDKIIIVISHRFHNQKVFQRILKLKDGKIYEK